MNPHLPHIVFAGNPLDRASDRRSDAHWLQQQRLNPDAVLLPLLNGNPLLHSPPRQGPVWLPLHDAKTLPDAVFLGLDKHAAPRFAAELSSTPQGRSLAESLQNSAFFTNLRDAASQNLLTRGEAAILAHAASLLSWRLSHAKCSKCGADNSLADGGSKALCSSCGAEHFPRTDPVVIMLPVHQNYAFLARQASWPPNRYSAPAGFLEPGESIEEAVARELTEEASIAVERVQYVASQPWPFPSSLMIGCIAFTPSRKFAINDGELESGDWFSRSDVAAALNNDPNAPFLVPPPFAIAHTLLREFIKGD